jgi:putative holliday junction resolvase
VTNPATSYLVKNPIQASRFLAFDFGTRRTGVAAGNRLTGSATPLQTIKVTGDARFELIAQLLKEWEPDALVIGIPFHPDGAEHENTLKARKFGRQLAGRFGLPIVEVDERYTTTEARSQGAKDLDAAAACIILEQHFWSIQ